jgi:hypothetical protein
MDLQLHFIRNLIASKLIKIIHVSGLKNFANFLTKPVGQTIIKRAISIFATSSPSISALCSQACGMLACQNADSVALHDPDVIMQSICKLFPLVPSQSMHTMKTELCYPNNPLNHPQVKN